MQLHIYHELKNPLTMPVNYNRIVQAIIYASLGKADYQGYMHDNGFSYGKRHFKLFCFSQITGRNKIRDKRITFFDGISFEVRSPDPFMIRTLAGGFAANGIRFGDVLLDSPDLTMTDATVESSMILVDMLSPLTIYSTEIGGKKKHYYKPDEEAFGSMLSDNFARKYQACYGTKPNEGVAVIPFQIGKSDHTKVRYKDSNITAFKGKYILAGQRKYLDFLYQTGLGSKNAQGLGMFEIISDDPLDLM